MRKTLTSTSILYYKNRTFLSYKLTTKVAKGKPVVARDNGGGEEAASYFSSGSTCTNVVVDIDDFSSHSLPVQSQWM